MSEVSEQFYPQPLARINARFSSERLARQAAVEMEQAGMRCTVPVWEHCTPSRPWLLQVTCPRPLSDGLDPIDQARPVIQRAVHRHDGVVVEDVPEHLVVPGVSHSLRPGGAPFVGRLPKEVVTRYERGQLGQVDFDHDEPLPGLNLP